MSTAYSIDRRRKKASSDCTKVADLPVTAEGNQQTWHYRDTYLTFANGKLARIQREQ